MTSLRQYPSWHYTTDSYAPPPTEYPSSLPSSLSPSQKSSTSLPSPQRQAPTTSRNIPVPIIIICCVFAVNVNTNIILLLLLNPPGILTFVLSIIPFVLTASVTHYLLSLTRLKKYDKIIVFKFSGVNRKQGKGI